MKRLFIFAGEYPGGRLDGSVCLADHYVTDPDFSGGHERYESTACAGHYVSSGRLISGLTVQEADEVAYEQYQWELHDSFHDWPAVGCTWCA